MAKDLVEIQVASEELARRAARVQRARRFQTVDYVPACPNLYVRYWLPKIGGSFVEYFTDPESMLRAQIYGQKWVLENVQSDLVFNPIAVDFQNAREAGSLGCEVLYLEDGVIWARGGWVRDEADLARLRRIDPLATGLQAKAVQFAEQMSTLADRYVVRFADGVEMRPAERVLLPAGTMGPFTVAAEVAGMTEILLDVFERPRFVHDLLSVVTDKIIAWLEYCDSQQGMGMLRVADDYAGNLSVPMFREFALPYLQRIRSRFADAYFWFHMCGKVDHLVPILIDELEIQEFGLFGYEVDKRRLQNLAGGRVVLTGNISPMTIFSGSPASVQAEAEEALTIFGGADGGFILADGANVAPDSPVENVSALWQASRRAAARRTAGDSWSSDPYA